MTMAKEKTNEQKEFYDSLLDKYGCKGVPLYKVDWFARNNIVHDMLEKFPDYKLFEQRGFDAQKKKFFVVEFSYDKVEQKQCIKRIFFDDFERYFDYLNGEIIEQSCYWGYTFSEEETNKYNLEKKNLNDKAFISYNIDDTIELIQEKKYNFEVQMTNAQIYISSFGAIKTVKDVEKFLDHLPSEYGRIRYSTERFLPQLMLLKGDSIKQPMIDYFTKNGNSFVYWVPNIIEMYGLDVAESIANNCSFGDYAPITVKKKQSTINKIIKKYKEPFVKKINAGFNEREVLYYVTNNYYAVDSEDCIMTSRQYFLDFYDFARYLDSDLSGADLFCAPVEKNDVLAFKTNSETKFPYETKELSVNTTKYYKDDEFVVEIESKTREGIIVDKKKRTFNYLCDFVYYLKGDLSNANLVECPGVEAIAWSKDCVLDNIKISTSAAISLGIQEETSLNFDDVLNFEPIENNEAETSKYLEVLHEFDEKLSTDKEVYYVTDLHLLHRIKNNKCKTNVEADSVIQKQVDLLLPERINDRIYLIGGDIASDFDVYMRFIDKIQSSSNLSCSDEFFVTLGNHELWPFEQYPLKDTIKMYKDLLSSNRIHFLQNNLYYSETHYYSTTFKEITEQELKEISIEKLKEITKRSSIIVFGGIGFSGFNSVYNADMGFYRKALNRQQEIEETEEFYDLYCKVSKALIGKNVIVLTHMPFSDWSKEENRVPGFVYVNGHDHRNYFFDDGSTRIYADNQIGYQPKDIAIKKFYVDNTYSVFADYSDGIHEISKAEYIDFYRGINTSVTINREYRYYMLKRNKTYMFLAENNKGQLLILSGGMSAKAEHDLQYYYKHMEIYNKRITDYMRDYSKLQEAIAKEVKELGGDGTIHGTIIDLDFFNHIYVNPLDKSIVPYFATAMTRKYVYKNVASLMKYQCPELFDRLSTISTEEKDLIVYERKNEISEETIFVRDTTMYRMSRLVCNLQYTFNYNVIRKWNDELLESSKTDNGQSIFLSVINQNGIGNT